MKEKMLYKKKKILVNEINIDLRQAYDIKFRILNNAYGLNFMLKRQNKNGACFENGQVRTRLFTSVCIHLVEFIICKCKIVKNMSNLLIS